eukprot:5750242-Pyramimonas_sp.AAC.1
MAAEDEEGEDGEQAEGGGGGGSIDRSIELSGRCLVTDALAGTELTSVDARARPAPTSPAQGPAGKVAPALAEVSRSAAGGLAGSAYPYLFPCA